MGRLELRPLGPIDDDVEGDLDRRVRPGLALGVAAAANFNTNRLRSTTGPTFAGGTTDHWHAAADLVFKWRGFALQGEYLWKRASVDEIRSVGPTGMPFVEHTRSAQGWIAQTSYVFDPPFEIVARVSRMRPFTGTDPVLIAELGRAGHEAAGGLNYYFNKHRFKLQADWIARTPTFLALGGRAEHVGHVQIDATF